jgi:hypothetical protein
VQTNPTYLLCIRSYTERPWKIFWSLSAHLDIEPEQEVDTDEKGPYILQTEVEEGIKETRNKKTAGDDDIPGDVLKLLGDGGLKIMTKLIKTIY